MFALLSVESGSRARALPLPGLVVLRLDALAMRARFLLALVQFTLKVQLTLLFVPVGVRILAVNSFPARAFSFLDVASFEEEVAAWFNDSENNDQDERG